MPASWSHLRWSQKRDECGFSYDDAGNVTQVIPPGRPAHDFTYTAVNLETTYDPPQVSPPLATVTTTTTYTDDGQVDVVTRPDGKQVDFDYDTSGRPEKITFQPSAQTTDFTYNSLTGTLDQVTTADVALSFSYDGGLPTATTWSGAAVNTETFTRTYNSTLLIASEQVGGKAPVTFGYDDDALLTAAGNASLVRNANTGLLTSTSISDGAGTVTDSRTYTLFAELDHYAANHDGAPVFETTYTRDELGRIIDVTETVTIAPAAPEVSTRHYEYDGAGRLYRVCGAATCTTVLSEYHYDNNGNRIAPSFNGQGAITTATYDDQDRLTALTQGPTTSTYAYTDNGELLTKTDPSGTTTYDYDALGNLLEVQLASGTDIDYVVDARNRRVGKKINGVLEHQWLYRNQLNPVAELDGNGNVISQFVYASHQSTPDYLIAYDPVTGNETGKYRIISDHLGSVRLVIDVATGTVVQRIDYDEFGVVLADSNPGFQPFGFAGGMYDPDTGLVRFGARDYDAAIGRWTAKDPIGFGGRDGNLYRYASANPLNRTDPTGRFSLLSAFGGASLGGVLNVALSLSDPNATQEEVVRALVSGSVSGFFAGFGAGPAIGIASSLAAQVTDSLLGGSPKDDRDIAIAIGTGIVTGFLGSRVSEATGNQVLGSVVAALGGVGVNLIDVTANTFGDFLEDVRSDG